MSFRQVPKPSYLRRLPERQADRASDRLHWTLDKRVFQSIQSGAHPDWLASAALCIKRRACRERHRWYVRAPALHLFTWWGSKHHANPVGKRNCHCTFSAQPAATNQLRIRPRLYYAIIISKNLSGLHKKRKPFLHHSSEYRRPLTQLIRSAAIAGAAIP